MTPFASAAFRAAVALAPRGSRSRLREAWASDLAEAPDHATEFRYSVGLLTAAARIRVEDRPRRLQVLAIVGSVVLLGAGGTLAHLQTPRPACGVPGQVLGVVAGDDHLEHRGTLPLRAQAAIRAVRASAGYEGVWFDPHRGIRIGVYGPVWPRAAAAATSIGSTPGPTITYVCQPATEGQLAAAQNGLARSTLWQQRVIGSSNIDVRNASVTVAISDAAPAGTESALRRAYGPLLAISRSRDPFVDLAPATGRMPLASDPTR